MTPDEPKKPEQSTAASGQRTSVEDSGLSFEEEPTGIDGSPDQGGSTGSDPGRSSPSAAFTPGPPAKPHSPFFTPAAGILLVIIISLVVAALWLI